MGSLLASTLTPTCRELVRGLRQEPRRPATPPYCTRGPKVFRDPLPSSLPLPCFPDSQSLPAPPTCPLTPHSQLLFPPCRSTLLPSTPASPLLPPPPSLLSRSPALLRVSRGSLARTAPTCGCIYHNSAYSSASLLPRCFLYFLSSLSWKHHLHSLVTSLPCVLSTSRLLRPGGGVSVSLSAHSCFQTIASPPSGP